MRNNVRRPAYRLLNKNNTNAFSRGSRIEDAFGEYLLFSRSFRLLIFYRVVRSQPFRAKSPYVAHLYLPTWRAVLLIAQSPTRLCSRPELFLRKIAGHYDRRSLYRRPYFSATFVLGLLSLALIIIRAPAGGRTQKCFLSFPSASFFRYRRDRGAARTLHSDRGYKISCRGRLTYQIIFRSRLRLPRQPFLLTADKKYENERVNMARNKCFVIIIAESRVRAAHGGILHAVLRARAAYIHFASNRSVKRTSN